MLVAASWGDFIGVNFPAFRYQDTIGDVNILQFVLTFDRFNVLVVFCLAGLHTASFCKDDNSNFLRMLLCRADITTYTQCRFIVNVIAILLCCEVSYFLFVILLLPLYLLISAEAAVAADYYFDIAVEMPFLYVGMMGLQFGMIAAACSSIGLLFSSFRSNAFVSIGISGLAFFWAISYCPLGTPVDLLDMIGMLPVLGREHIW